MNMMNMVVCQGYLGTDAETKNLGDGNLVASMRLASTKRYLAEDGERRERTTWVRVVTFQRDLIERVLKKRAVKGAQVIVHGELRSSQWVDANGNRRESVELHIGPKHTFQILCDGPGANGASLTEPGNKTTGANKGTGEKGGRHNERSA